MYWKDEKSYELQTKDILCAEENVKGINQVLGGMQKKIIDIF